MRWTSSKDLAITRFSSWSSPSFYSDRLFWSPSRESRSAATRTTDWRSSSGSFALDSAPSDWSGPLWSNSSQIPFSQKSARNKSIPSTASRECSPSRATEAKMDSVVNFPRLITRKEAAPSMAASNKRELLNADLTLLMLMLMDAFATDSKNYSAHLYSHSLALPLDRYACHPSPPLNHTDPKPRNPLETKGWHNHFKTDYEPTPVCMSPVCSLGWKGRVSEWVNVQGPLILSLHLSSHPSIHSLNQLLPELITSIYQPTGTCISEFFCVDYAYSIKSLLNLNF